MIVIAIHNHSITNHEYKQKLIKRYNSLSSNTFQVIVKRLGETENQPNAISIYFDGDSISRCNDKVLAEIKQYPNARVVWVSLDSKKAAIANPDGGERHRTFTTISQAVLKDESNIL